MYKVSTSQASTASYGQEAPDGSGTVVDLVILAGAVGREPPWACGVPRPLLPLPTGTVIGSLLRGLGDLRTGAVVVCTNGTYAPASAFALQLRAEAADISNNAHVMRDWIPRGTAGCIKTCASTFQGKTILVSGASVWLEDDPQWLLDQHRERGNALTIFCTPGPNGVRGGRKGWLRPAGLYACEPEVLDFIPERGYFDLKEQLVPALQKAELPVGAITLKNRSHEVTDWAGYLEAVGRVLVQGLPDEVGFREAAPGIWTGRDVEIAPTARVVGPAFLGHRCRLDAEALVIGPAMLGDNTVVHAGSRLLRVVAPQALEFARETHVADQLVCPRPFEPTGVTATSASHNSPAIAYDGLGQTSEDQTGWPSKPTRSKLGSVLAGSALLAGLLVWAFWYTFVDLWAVWQGDADYGAGQLVPFAAAYMIVVRRSALRDVILGFSLKGLSLFMTGLIINLLGSYYLYSSLENAGLVLCVNGLVVTLFGWQGYKRIWYPMLFLFLMIPLPGRVHDAVMLPLQELSASVAAGVLETTGLPAERFGHVLDIGSHKVAVAEACSGLRMALAFLIVACVAAYFVGRPRWQKVVIVASSVPIALICNVARVVVTACLYNAGYERLAQGAMHDVAGLLMMPAAVGLIFLELWLLSSLNSTPGEERVLHAVPGIPGG